MDTFKWDTFKWDKFKWDKLQVNVAIIRMTKEMFCNTAGFGLMLHMKA